MINTRVTILAINYSKLYNKALIKEAITLLENIFQPREFITWNADNYY